MLVRALALALATALVSVPAPASAASDRWDVEGEPTLRIQGRGFGHGHGMSQYGAEGAARQGLSAEEILAFYYPGTEAGRASGRISVLVSADTTDDLVVRPRSGLRLTDLGTGERTVLPDDVGAQAVEHVVRRADGGTQAARHPQQVGAGSPGQRHRRHQLEGGAGGGDHGVLEPARGPEAGDLGRGLQPSQGVGGREQG